MRITYSLFALGVLSTSALAADLPMRAPPQGPLISAPAFTWSGCYVGATVGYVKPSSSRTPISGSPDLQDSQELGNVPYSLNNRSNGVAVGPQIGCNHQMGSLVIGAELDVSYLDISKTSVVTQGFANVTTSFSRSLDVLGTLRARVGFAFDQALIYATGGLAVGNASARAAIVPGPGIVGPTLRGSDDDTRFGWVVGAGIEYAIAPSWSVKAEYLYFDLGTETLTATTVGGGPETATFRYKTSGNIVRAGVNYRF